MNTDPDIIKKLILDSIGGTITPEDRIMLEQLLAEDEAARVMWQEMHDRFDSPEAHAQIAESLSRLNPERALQLARRRSRLVRLRAVAAAAASILVVATVYFLSREEKKPGIAHLNNRHVQMVLEGSGGVIDLTSEQGNLKRDNINLQNGNKTLTLSPEAIGRPQWVTVSVPVAQDYKIALPDGSVAWLNAGTSLRFPTGFAGEREVFINGEAYFDIKPDAAHPFIVHLPSSRVQVLGTEFNVNTYDSTQAEVALVHGSVRFSNVWDSVVLKPGYRVLARTGRKPMVGTFEASEVLAWRQGIHLLEKAPAGEVARQLYRNFGVEVKLDGTPSADHTFTGAMDRKKPIKEYLDNLKYLGFITGYTFTADNVLHLRFH